MNNPNTSDVDTSDWESRMAKLVGLEEHPTHSKPQNINTTQPQEVQTKQALSSSPFAKLGLVGAATFTIVLVAGVFLSQLMDTSNQKPTQSTITIQPQPTLQASPQLESEVENLKTKLALTEQAQAVKVAQEKLRNPVPVATSKPQTVVRTQPPVTNRVRVSFPNTPIARSNYTPRVSSQPERIRIVTIPQPQPPRPQLIQPTPKPTPPITPNLLEDLVKLAELNNYYENQSSPVASNTPTVQPTPTPAPLPVIPPTPTPNIVQTPAPVIVSNPTPTPAPIQQSPLSVAVGSSVKAVFATAVFGETTRSTNTNRNDRNESEKPVFVVRLQEPLKSTDGQIALPAKTELLAEINSISEQGLTQLNVTKLITKNGNTISEKPLPQNAIIIRAREGRPLIANQYPNRGGSIAWMDTGLFVLGGLGKAAELVNRTESQVVVTSGAGTTISNTNARRNILAGVAEGGISTIVPQIAQRNQQAISQMTQRSNIWFLPAGKEVEVYINQTMQF
ncbi:MAG: TrbI/VirB10 family protein [Calothrix sp. C42_A2020_038]|nr:TrbI/VirB10 family protein [Calothrix sp. C42_A2020_038]